MERSDQNTDRFQLITIGFLTFIFILLSARHSVAGAVAGAATGTVAGEMGGLDQEHDTFPASRFGSPPSPPVYGLRSPGSLIRRELSEESLDQSQGGRGLASVKAPTHSDPKFNSDSRTGVQEVALIATDQGYYPKTVFVTRDIPVRLFVTGASKKTLCIMMDSFQVRKQLRSQKVEEISFVPSEPGQFRFYCPINGMEGSLFVKELSTGSKNQLPEWVPSQKVGRLGGE